MKLSYRLHRDDDLPALQRLWERESGWGALTRQLWDQYVVNGPLGGMAAVVATDDETGEIVGQFVFVPSLVAVDGRVVRAFRPGAPLLAKSLRGLFRTPNVMHHPVVAMYTHAVRALRARGDGLIYMVPDARWRHFFRLVPVLHCATFPLWSLPLPLDAPLALGDGYAASPLGAWDERVDRLWEAASRLYPCAVVRDARSLPVKLSDGKYTVLLVERAGEPVGLVAARRKGDRQWLICDVLAVDAGDALRATLAAACNAGHERVLAGDGHAKPMRKAAVLVTPLMEPVVGSLGFQRDKYDFPVVVHFLDQTLTEAAAPARWYVSAND